MDNSNEEDMLIRLRLFTKDRIKEIKTMRNLYEGKIRRKDKQSFFAYIELEKKILQEIQEDTMKTDDLTKQITLRIIRIHNIALSSFKEELKFWVSYIKFCTENGFTDLVAKSIPLLVDIHKHEEKVWHLAAKWELNKFNNKEKALNYLYKGLNIHPKSESIYKHILWLVLSKFNSPNNVKVTNEKQLENIQKEGIELFQKAIKANLDADVYKEMLNLSTEYGNTQKLQYLISQFIITKFEKNYEIWHFLAQRELEGHHIAENNFENVSNIDDRIKNCIKLYEKSVEILPNEKMWEKFLDTLVNLQQSYSSNDFIKQTFISHCNEAHKNGFMTIKHYLLWLKLLNNSEQVAEILEHATKNQPNCVQLWDERIKYHFNKKEQDLVDKVFDEAIKSLKDKSLPLWRRKLQYYQLKGDSVKIIESIFRDGLNYSPIISQELQPQFLEWTALFRSRNVAQNLYKELAANDDVCLELHKKMAQLEAMSSDPDVEIFNAIKENLEKHEDKLREWNEYVTQEIHYGPSWRSDIYKKYLSSG